MVLGKQKGWPKPPLLILWGTGTLVRVPAIQFLPVATLMEHCRR